MFGRGIGVPELLIILVIVLLLFGPSRLSKIAGEIGKGIKNFRTSMKDDEKEDDKPKSPTDES